MNIDVFLNEKYKQYEPKQSLSTLDLYKNIKNNNLKILFAVMHQKFNELFKFMYSKSKSNNHYNAEPSRELLDFIKLYKDMEYCLKESSYSFKINSSYLTLINFCNTFLSSSGGSLIPTKLPQITLLEYDPIFELTQSIQVFDLTQNKKSYALKSIGEGSYAKIYKYIDEFYNTKFVIKRAKKDLNSKEIKRFKKEFEIMKALNSPYILNVFSYNDNSNEYTMEYADDTLYNYIAKNNNKLTITERKKLVNQILKGFSYIHSKNLLHRDISLTNILIINYDDVSIIKISDFGLVKEEFSNLTSVNSDIKGSLNDSNLQFIGFNNYSIEHETFALTRVIYYIMTGRINMSNENNSQILNFVNQGINPNIDKRYKNINELYNAFKKTF